MQNKIGKISVIGLGYIGLPTAAVLAGSGVEVIGVDVNPNAVETINRGEIHIVEPDLAVMVRGAVMSGRLKAVLKPEKANVFIVAVPTPITDSHEPDISYVEAAFRSIAPMLEKGNIVILESTSPVGTTEKMALLLSDLRSDLTFPHQLGAASDIRLAYVPERVLPGKVLLELTSNDRVIGGMTAACSAAAEDIYRLFVKGQCALTEVRTAEMVKLTENAFRDVNIAFANELSLICDKLDINVWELIQLANLHPRVNVLQPGPGVGGHCIAVDPWFIVHSAPELARLIAVAREVNDSKPRHVINMIREKAKRFKSPTIACLGLAFKANIDDLRESPAASIVTEMAGNAGWRLLVAEPNISQMPSALGNFANVRLVDVVAAIRESDIVVLLVDHKEFLGIDMKMLDGKEIVDTRGVWKSKPAHSS